jgi:Mg-chelatase subunit ChlI
MMTPGWQKKVDHVMCAYKLVTIKVAVFGFQTKAESYAMGTETQIFLKFHQQLFCWLDEWYGLSLSEILEQEKKIYAEMNKRLEKDDAETKPEDEAKAKELLAEAAAKEAAADGADGEEKKEKKVHKHKHREHDHHKKHRKHKKPETAAEAAPAEKSEEQSESVDESAEASASI